MENISVSKRTGTDARIENPLIDPKFLSGERTAKNPVLENILSEGGDDLFQYLNWTGLAKEPNLMVLSSMHHYYYDHDDLAGIKTLINIKRLNQIKHLESFLHTLYRILPVNSYFVGCFRNAANKGNDPVLYQSARFINGLMNILDSRIERTMSKRSVTKILEENGFKIIDITDINGISYFLAQNNRKHGE